MSLFKLTVFVKPTPQGSMKGFVLGSKNGGKPRAILTADNKKLKPYRQEVAQTAIVELQRRNSPRPLADKHVPVRLEMDFYLQKPVSVSKKRTMPAVKPDLSKLIRSTEDALTGILYADDAQIVDLRAVKYYGVPERVEIRMYDCSVDMIALHQETFEGWEDCSAPKSGGVSPPLSHNPNFRELKLGQYPNSG